MREEKVLENLNPQEQWDLLVQQSLYGNFTPFEGQLKLYEALFKTKCKVLFEQCGRGWSKTYSAVWLASRWALTWPDQYVLYLAPQYKQAKKIVWYPKLFERFIAEELIARKDKQETYYELINYSRIDLDGSDNFDSQRGLKPNLVIADEYREFNREWIDVMFPNIVKSEGVIFFMGTPPHFPKLSNGEDHHYITWRNYCAEMMKKDAKRYFHIHLPTWDNPYISKTALASEKKRLTDLGLDHVWHREYGAEVVSGSQAQVFKMFDEEKHTTPKELLLEEIHQAPDKYEYYVAADPGTKSTFGVLFCVLDRYSSTPYVVSEIYQQDASLTSTRNILPEILNQIYEINEDFSDWIFIADSAAAWFIQEVIDWFESEVSYKWFEEHNLEHIPLFFEPTEKRIGDKEEGINLIKDLFLEKEHFISDSCESFQLEIVNYQTDKQGRYVKENDHLLDAFRYFLKRSLFSFKEDEVVVKEEPDKPRGWSSLSEQYMEYRKQHDWTYGIG